MPKIGKKRDRNNPPRDKPAGSSDWPGVARLAIGGATMVAVVVTTSSVEAAVVVGSAFGAMTPRS